MDEGRGTKRRRSEVGYRKSEVGDKKAQSSGLKDRRRVLEGWNAIKLGSADEGLNERDLRSEVGDRLLPTKLAKLGGFKD
jgi:hypothetical protein